MRRRTALAALTGLAVLPPLAALAFGGPDTAHGAEAEATVRIVVDADGPLLDDGGALYDVRVRNTGPGTATGLVLRAVTRTCSADGPQGVGPCVPGARRFFQVGDLPTGRMTSFTYTVRPGGGEAAQIRTFMRVVAVDQVNTGGVDGCDTVADAHDSCAMLVYNVPR